LWLGSLIPVLFGYEAKQVVLWLGSLIPVLSMLLRSGNRDQRSRPQREQSIEHEHEQEIAGIEIRGARAPSRATKLWLGSVIQVLFDVAALREPRSTIAATTPIPATTKNKKQTARELASPGCSPWLPKTMR